MHAIEAIYWTFGAFLAYMSVVWCLRVQQGFRIRDRRFAEFNKWQIESEILGTKTETTPALFILLPMLREQRCIHAAIEHFLEMPYPGKKCIVVITTEKEAWEKQQLLEAACASAESERQNCIDDLKRFLHIVTPIEDDYVPSDFESLLEMARQSKTTAQLASSLVSDEVMHIHYPRTSGVMAHQLNFAILQLREKAIVSGSDFYAIYNADSRPENFSFEELIFRVEQNPDQSVFQQLSLYLNNLGSLSRSAQRPVLRTAAWWQCRWSFGWEIPHAESHYHFLLRRKDEPRISMLDSILHEQMVYTIGHGLFLQDKILEKTKLFPEATMNEDAGLGLLMNWKRIPIYPMASLDRAGIPSSIAVLRRQKGTWYWGVLQAFSYAQHFPDFGGGDFRLWWLSLSLFNQSICWFFMPVFIFALLFVGFCLSPLHFAIAMLMPIFFLCLPHRIVAKGLYKRELVSKWLLPRNSILDWCAEFYGALLFYIVHWLGALTCLFQATLWFVTGQRPEKFKTEG